MHCVSGDETTTALPSCCSYAEVRAAEEWYLSTSHGGGRGEWSCGVVDVKCVMLIICVVCVRCVNIVNIWFRVHGLTWWWAYVDVIPTYYVAYGTNVGRAPPR